ncbi:hypothetical protein FIBSPDRAFT_872168 [Athelia psychrophila]|uniref:Uncharacterized protein n=1 Tax=Athelia psychrophila TaxID=1759441 RepID=A0A165ZR92_9AGAM|nr:hypothetical protein FIBSPDRAFT_872168 [Fibularhizoctonia sp. CBS 109695]
MRDEAPMPNMLVNGVLISRDELDMLELEGDDIHREMEDLTGSGLFGSRGNQEGGEDIRNES